jgi:hypothetical protein
MKRAKPNWSDLREALWERCGGVCEVSGQPLDRDTFDAHHRRNKGMGGTYRPDTDTLPNLLALAPFVHNLSPGSVHGNPDWSMPRGYLLHQGAANLHLVPVLLHGKLWVMLTPTGLYAPVPAALLP